jgi:hypothetical protein
MDAAQLAWLYQEKTPVDRSGLSPIHRNRTSMADIRFSAQS